MARKDFIRSEMRLPALLWDALKAAAEKNNRSANGELVARLLTTFDDLSTEDEAVEDETPRAQMKLRLPAEVMRVIQSEAKRNKRSVNAQIVVILQEFVASQEKAP